MENFDITCVPSVTVILPHKNDFDTKAAPAPEWISAKVAELDTQFKQMFEKEKQMAFREIESMVKSNPVMMFIKGTLDTPKCKFTRKLSDALAPFKYRNIKTFSILDD